MAPPPVDAAPPAVAPAPSRPKTCDVDPDISKHAKEMLDCAREVFARGEYDIADNLAADLIKRFPYSKVSTDAEELRGDVLAARHDWEGAVDAYDHFVKFHPTNERVEDVRKKLANAQAELDK